ncbi:MAG: hypothetical protein ACXVCP_13150 [Bdellovibrio sp.]
MTLIRLFTAYIFFCSSLSFAATVSAVKGTKVLINLESDTIEANEEFYLINPDSGKKAAIIRVQQVKGQKALADILKGKAKEGYTLQAKGASSLSSQSGETNSVSALAKTSENTTLKILKDSYGVTAGYITSTMSADVSYKDGFGITRTTNAGMNGSGFALGGFYDYVFNPDLVGRAAANIEQFNVSGSASAAGCSGGTNCDAKINYLSLYALGKWYPLQGKYRMWLGGGAGYLLALSKSSTALNESQISTNQVFTASIGTDIQQNRSNYIPISIEYSMFPDSPTVKANMIVVKAGWAWNL